MTPAAPPPGDARPDRPALPRGMDRRHAWVLTVACDARTRAAVPVAIALSSYADLELQDTPSPGARALAERIRAVGGRAVPERTLARHLSRLRAAGYLSAEGRPGRPTHHTLRWPAGPTPATGSVRGAEGDTPATTDDRGTPDTSCDIPTPVTPVRDPCHSGPGPLSLPGRTPDTPETHHAEITRVISGNSKKQREPPRNHPEAEGGGGPRSRSPEPDAEVPAEAQRILSEAGAGAAGASRAWRLALAEADGDEVRARARLADAAGALAEARRRGTVRSAVGYLLRAIAEGWRPESPLPAHAPPPAPARERPEAPEERERRRVVGQTGARATLAILSGEAPR